MIENISFKSLRFLTTVCFFSLLFLASCEQAAVVNNDVMRGEKEAQNAIDSISPDTNQHTPLQIDSRPWYGAESIPLKNGASLPQQFMGSNAITLTFTGAETMDEVARKVEGLTGIPVSLSKNVYESTMGETANRPFIPAGAQEVSGGRMVWSGSLQNLLNQMANIYGSEWNYDNGVITFNSELTKTFMLNALAGDLAMIGSASSSGGSGTNAPNLEVNGTTTLEIWGEISETVETIIGDAGKVTFSPSTGAITVTGRPDVLRRVENYLRYQNQMRLRRIAISVKVLSVTTSDSENYGADVTSIIDTALGGGYRISNTGTAANGLTASIVKNGAAGGAAFDNVNLATTLTASKGIERANVVHSGSLVTLSDQPAPLQVSRQIAYLARATTSGDTGSVSLEPDTVDLGLFMTVLPRIVEDDRILMRLSISITDADPNFRTFGTTDVQLELPEVDTTGFLQNAVVGNGETLVLAGFEKTNSILSDKQTPAGFLLGGSRETTRGREMLVLIINSRILPEQPLTIIGQ